MTKKEKTVKEQLKALGIGFQARKEWGDYRVFYPLLPAGRQEATAYYTRDLEDAFDTGVVMAQSLDTVS